MHRDLTALAPHERLTELPVLLREKPHIAPQLEKTYETPQSLGDEGLHFMHCLESYPVSSLQTPEEV